MFTKKTVAPIEPDADDRKRPPSIAIGVSAKKKAKRPAPRAIPEYQKIGAQMLAPGAGKGVPY